MTVILAIEPTQNTFDIGQGMHFGYFFRAYDPPSEAKSPAAAEHRSVFVHPVFIRRQEHTTGPVDTDGYPGFVLKPWVDFNAAPLQSGNVG